MSIDDFEDCLRLFFCILDRKSPEGNFGAFLLVVKKVKEVKQLSKTIFRSL